MLRTTLAVLVLVVATVTAEAEQKLTPSWMKVEGGAKKVEMDVVAGFNANNSSWNYNGFYEGNATVVVPAGWSVRIAFGNKDGDVPHSLVVTRVFAPEEMPLEAGREQAAISRAYSKSPVQGLSAGEKDTISFKAAEPGEYLWFCGVPGHGQSGMWIHFKIAADADAPYLTVAEGAEPGRT